MNRRFLGSPVPTLLGLLLLCGSAKAQNDPSDVVRQIADEVNRELKEIDRLLGQSGRTEKAHADEAKELVGRSQQSMEKVVRGIDRMIDELQKMAQQNQSQQSSQNRQGQSDPESQDQQQQQQQQQQDGEGQPQNGRPRPQSGKRRENDTPDLAPQPDQGDGQQQQQSGQQPQQGQPNPAGEQPQPGSGRPNNGQRDPLDPGRNRTDGSPTQGDSERVERATEEGDWGDLPKYEPETHLRGGAPAVPSKYRRAWEEFQRRAALDRNKEKKR